MQKLNYYTDNSFVFKKGNGMFLFCHCKKGDRLLDLLASADHTWLPMEILMERLGLSRRSVLYLMKKVNASLEAQGIPTIANQRGRGYFLLIYTSVFSLILRFSQFFKTTRLPHAGILRHLVSEAAGRSDLRVQQTERRSLKFFEKAFCVPASPAVA